MSRRGGGLFSLIKLGVFIAKRISGSSGAGRRGERAVRWRLGWLPDEYFVLNDLMLDRGHGYTSQIDHVVVSRYGIFVIETKNISGYIYGSERAQTWKRIWKAWYHGFERSNELEFDNPIHQNEAHIKALSAKLGSRATKFIPIIAFSTNAELRVSAEHTHVVYSTQMRRLIRAYNEPVMSLEQAKQIYDYLLSINVTDEQVREQHSARAQINKSNYRYRQQESLANGKCPQCGGNLILRNGKFGAFYGCSNYSNCKYTHPVTEY